MDACLIPDSSFLTLIMRTNCTYIFKQPEKENQHKKHVILSERDHKLVQGLSTDRFRSFYAAKQTKIPSLC